jgi:hypothetical protein
MNSDTTHPANASSGEMMACEGGDVRSDGEARRGTRRRCVQNMDHRSCLLDYEVVDQVPVRGQRLGPYSSTTGTKMNGANRGY